VLAASALLAVFLAWGAQHFDWLALRTTELRRAGLLALLLCTAVLLYFGALWACGLRLRQLLRR
jgi:putative peptidoglycan lipid II flippase